jgi:hypothetical protein
VEPYAVIHYADGSINWIAVALETALDSQGAGLSIVLDLLLKLARELACQFGCVELPDLSRTFREALEQRARNVAEVASQVITAAKREANALRLRYGI